MRNSRFPLWAFILTGFLAAGREFAFLGFPPLYMGEAYLGFNILRNRHNWLGQFVDDVLRFDFLSVTLAANLLWGVIEVFRCLYLGRAPLDVIRTCAVNYYPLYLLAGIAMGRDFTLPQFVRVWKYVVCLYVGYIGFADVAVAMGNQSFGVPGISALVPVVTVALWPYLRGWPLRWIALAGSLYPVVFVSGHGRGSVLGLLFGLGAIALTSGVRISKIFIGVGGALLLGFVVGPYIPGPDSSPPLDPVVHAARLVATFNPTLASKMLDNRGYHDEATIIIYAEGTAKWRQQLWTNAIRSLNTTPLLLLGQGHGATMQDLVPDKQDIHTPHNFTIYCLYYTGAIGLLVFCCFLLAILLSGRSMKNLSLRSALSGAMWAMVLTAVTGNCLETPFGAIPFYLLSGLILGVDRGLPMKKPRAVLGARTPMNPQMNWRNAPLRPAQKMG